MATLTQTAYFARKAIKYGGIFLVALILLRAGYITLKKLIPPKPVPLPPANIAFGKLPSISFPQKETLYRINYRLETVSGSLPTISSQAKVYFMPEFSPGFMTQDKIITWAKTLGFNTPLQTTKYNLEVTFTFNSPYTNNLKVNLLTRNFSYTYDWRNDPSSFQTPLETSQALSRANAFLQSAESLNKDLDTANPRIVSLKMENNTLIETLPEEANLFRINFFRLTPDNLKILPADPKNSNVYVTVSNLNNNFNGVIEAQYIYHLISTDINATYPLKDVNLAWQQLLEGKGFIANMGDNPEGNIVIRNAYLAYFEPADKQSYLQPVIVFEGDRDFTAYVPAITDNLFSQ